MQELHEIPSRSLGPCSALTRSAIYPFPRVESQKQSRAELKEDGGGKREHGKRIEKAGRSTMIQTVCEFDLTG